MSQEMTDKVKDAAERIMWEQNNNTEDAITVAEQILSPTLVTSGGVGVDSDGEFTLSLNGQRVPIAKDVAQAILRGLLHQASVKL